MSNPIIKTEHMQFSKSTLLSILGLLVMLFIIAMSYLNGKIFLDKILVSSVILGLIFFFKILEERSSIDRKSDRVN
jgi:hypothetical protein